MLDCSSCEIKLKYLNYKFNFRYLTFLFLKCKGIVSECLIIVRLSYRKDGKMHSFRDIMRYNEIQRED